MILASSETSLDWSPGDKMRMNRGSWPERERHSLTIPVTIRELWLLVT